MTVHRLIPALLTAVVVFLFNGKDSFAIPLAGNNAPQNFADIVQPLMPSVVNISTTTELKRDSRQEPFQGFPPGSPMEELFRQFFGDQVQPTPRKATALGSGFIVSQEGNTAFVVTCNHVIAEADEIKVILHNDIELQAQVVGRDKRTDLALLKVKTKEKLTLAEWGDSSKSRVGEWVIAIGNPFGLSSTVTIGVISTIARDIGARVLGGADYVDGYIQTDAPINMGNSGGPMFGVDGKVLAISTAIYSPNGGSIGIGFGIPANLAKQVIQQLKQFGHTRRGWLGVRIQSITPDIAESLGLKEHRGALVGEVARKGPGEKAGLKTGDVILKFNGIDIKESRQLPRVVGETEIGKKVPLELLRDGKKMALSVTVGEFEKAEKEGLISLNPSQDESVNPKGDNKILGMIMGEITSVIRERYGIPEDQKGVMVTFVDPTSEAAQKGFRPGDIIKQMTSGASKIEPTTPKQIRDFITQVKKAGHKKVLLLINTGGNLRYGALSLEEEAAAK
jgi:periplasmic serine protease, Do/DeqQ family